MRAGTKAVLLFVGIAVSILARRQVSGAEGNITPRHSVATASADRLWSLCLARRPRLVSG